MQAGVWEKLESKSKDGRGRERQRCWNALELPDGVCDVRELTVTQRHC